MYSRLEMAKPARQPFAKSLGIKKLRRNVCQARIVWQVYQNIALDRSCTSTTARGNAPQGVGCWCGQPMRHAFTSGSPLDRRISDAERVVACHNQGGSELKKNSCSSVEVPQKIFNKTRSPLSSATDISAKRSAALRRR